MFDITNQQGCSSTNKEELVEAEGVFCTALLTRYPAILGWHSGWCAVDISYDLVMSAVTLERKCKRTCHPTRSMAVERIWNSSHKLLTWRGGSKASRSIAIAFELRAHQVHFDLS
mmetsp:Transcript_19303/g.33114  ORF Transcript_19303/g.33114 Transcript_19303/m.33114 type:complete len:115 (-) Transcript_19303:89-433(-)